MPKNIIKRTVVISGHETSVSLEPEFWEVLGEIAGAKNISVAAFIRQVDEYRAQSERDNLSSAIRIFILKYLQEQIKKIS